jgi:hypothetical protein
LFLDVDPEPIIAAAPWTSAAPVHCLATEFDATTLKHGFDLRGLTKSVKQTESRAIKLQHFSTRRAFSFRVGEADLKSSPLI